ncbi:MAG: hypothetical protein NT067_04920 [Candidatus Diapherotrites archaeon]|nr:hypothetical protein [Candidatus Diapherotrites archaeon]
MAGRILRIAKKAGQAVKHRVTRLKAAGSAAKRAVRKEDLAYLKRRISAIEQAREKHPGAAHELGKLNARRKKLEGKIARLGGKNPEQ